MTSETVTSELTHVLEMLRSSSKGLRAVTRELANDEKDYTAAETRAMLALYEALQCSERASLFVERTLMKDDDMLK